MKLHSKIAAGFLIVVTTFYILKDHSLPSSCHYEKVNTNIDELIHDTQKAIHSYIIKRDSTDHG